MPDENVDPTVGLGDFLSSSPRSSILLESYLLRDREEEKPDGPSGGGSHNNNRGPVPSSSIPLHAFVASIPSLIATYRDLPRCEDGTGPLSKPIQEVLGRVELPPGAWDRYAVLNPAKDYTRNLVATDHHTYTLLVLVWTPGRASPIHDHPCDGCWMRVLSGSIRECRYAPAKNSSSFEEGAVLRSECGYALLECVQDDNYHEGQVLYIEDCLGYHKVENPSLTQPAVTLHLYSPPFDRCRVWHDEASGGAAPSSSSRSSCVRYDSEYGIPN